MHRGRVYLVNKAGAAACLDARDGKPLWTERIGSCWASALGAGDRVYFFGKDGLTTVLRTGPKFEVLAENELWDPKSIKPDTAKKPSTPATEVPYMEIPTFIRRQMD